MDDEVRQARLEEAARLFDAAAAELDQAAAHARRAGEHFRTGEVPRATAHAWATLGHVRAAEDSLLRQAREHRERAAV